MKYEIEILPEFAKRLKRLVKKFRTLPNEVEVLFDELSENPEMGTDLGEGLRKIRLGSKSKGGGKRGGFRVVTYLLKETEKGTEIYLVTIYDKSEEENISKDELREIVKSIFE